MGDLSEFLKKKYFDRNVILIIWFNLLFQKDLKLIWNFVYSLIKIAEGNFIRWEIKQKMLNIFLGIASIRRLHNLTFFKESE